MQGWATRMRLKHYIDRGLTKAELSRKLSENRAFGDILLLLTHIGAC